jgi:hypothetical protein
MSLVRTLPATLAWLVLVGALAGCSPGQAPSGGPPSPAESSAPRDDATAHDPDDVPTTEKDIDMPKDYAALVARLEHLAGDIRTKIAAGTPTKAHRSLDELDLILKRAPEIAARSVPKEHWKQVNLQSKALAEAHNELHEAIDEKRTPDYAAAAGRIQGALQALKGLPRDAGAPPEAK